MPEPRLSIIIGTDNFARVATLVESAERQTIANDIELVVVASDTGDIEANVPRASFHSVQIIPTKPIVALAAARATGVRASKAPAVFIAETHAYPDPDFCEIALRALSDEWAAVVPGFRNSNPVNSLSWAGFLSDYGPWLESRERGQTDYIPSHDVVFRKDVLLEFGDRLDNALTFGDELYLGLRARNHKALFEPAARIQHVNIIKLDSFVYERHIAGRLIGSYRSRRWSYPKRVAYAAASPLIFLVILRRMWPGVREARRRKIIPAGTIRAVLLGLLVKSAGEFRGYLAGAQDEHERKMTGFEVRKLAFNTGEERP
jgi:hypothetical protein